MKFDFLIKFIEKYFFFRNHADIEAKSLVPDLFLFFKKALIYKALHSLNIF